VPPEKATIVHYASVSYPAMIWKQILYAVAQEREYACRDGDEIADRCFMNLDETTLEVGPVPAEWRPLP
jgi:hypothetical protein